MWLNIVQTCGLKWSFKNFPDEMKRCPQCRRDYYDDTLMYCLDDGAKLLEGAARPDIIPSEARTRQIAKPLDKQPVTELLATGPVKKTRNLRFWQVIGAVTMVALAISAGGYFYYERTSRPMLVGSFREPGSPAYDYYLRGKLDSNSENAEQNANAVKVLEDVVKTDPSFAPAYAELARSYAIRADNFAPEGEKAKLFDDARVAVEKSLVLDPNLAEGHVVRAYVMWTTVGRFPHEQAVQSLKRALELDPNLESAHKQLGFIYLHIGLFDKAEDECQKALSIDPTDLGVRLRLGQIAVYRTNYDNALSIMKTVPTNANPAIVNSTMATIMFQLGRTDEAENIVERFLATNADAGGNVTSVKAMLLAKAGRANEAEELIERAIEIGRGYQHFHHTSYNISSAYALMAKPDDAIKWLQVTVDEGFPCYPLFEKDHNLDTLRHDERFITMMEKLEQQWQRYKAEL